MKKLILGVLALVLAVNYASAQGEVQLQNSSSASQKIFLNNVVGGWSTSQVGSALPGNATTSYIFLLFVNSTVNPSGGVASTLTASATPWTGGGWTSTGATANNTALTGRILGNDNANAYGVVPGPGFGPGVNANLELIGWNVAVGGSTLSSFLNAYNAGTAGLVYGYSAVANITLGDNGATVNNSGIFGSPSVGAIGGFTLAPIPTPEPGTMALAALGGASLLLFRRKK